MLDQILSRLPRLTIGVLGDLFLDRYLDLDAALTEPSVETGLDAYQVARVRSYPGAAGTVLNNLSALGIGRVVPIAAIGDDGEGYELRQELWKLPGLDPTHIIACPSRRTPTYCKPMLVTPGTPPRELNRLDTKNRTPTPPDVEEKLLAALNHVWPRVQALVVMDQVSEADCSVVTGQVRRRLAELAAADPSKLVLADSRERIGLFRHVTPKVNRAECQRAANIADWQAAARWLSERVGRPVVCTLGDAGCAVIDATGIRELPGYPTDGPTDPVGAGDSVSAGIVAAFAAGATLAEAAAFGNLVASITVQQIGVTGTATPAQLRQQWLAVQVR